MATATSKTYWPKSFDEIVGNERHIRIIQALLKKGQFRNILLYGPPGTGKTSTLECTAKHFDAFHLLKINASIDRGLNIIQSAIKPFVSKQSSSPKLILLDELDSMTSHAQDELVYLMKNFSGFYVMAACNDDTKVNLALKATMLPLYYGPLTEADMMKKSKAILHERNLRLEEESKNLAQIIATANGDMRNVIHFLYSANTMIEEGETIISSKIIDEVCDQPVADTVNALVDQILSGKEGRSLQIIATLRQIFEEGFTIEMMASQIKLTLEVKSTNADVRALILKEFLEFNVRTKFEEAKPTLLQLQSTVLRLYKSLLESKFDQLW